jgi:CBS domain-containing protein
MKVEELMTKSVGGCSPQSALNDVAQIMWENDCGFVPVVESEGSNRVVGVITDRDICMAAYTQGQALKDLRVESALEKSVHTCRPSDSVTRAEGIMQEKQVRRVPVVDDGNHLLGVISLADIARAIKRGTGSRRGGVTPGQIGETLAAISRPPRS